MDRFDLSNNKNNCYLNCKIHPNSPNKHQTQHSTQNNRKISREIHVKLRNHSYRCEQFTKCKQQKLRM